MIGNKVKHAILGVGEIIDLDENYITVAFANRTSKFKFPDAFESFIKAEDSSLQETIMREIAEAKSEAERKRIEEEEAKKAAEAKKAEEQADYRLTIAKKTAYSSKVSPRMQRIEGKPMIFYVFQGDSFNIEYNGGFIWAPKFSKSGGTIHHWERLLNVRKGDIILHGSDGYVKAISVAKDSCYDCSQPDELAEIELWDPQGRRVDCDYVLIKDPIKTSHFVDDIMKFNKVKYFPFDKDGNGNMGYLYEINKELARVFVKASVKQNPYLESEEFICEFLAEESND